jgi:hypothetical protein
VEVELKHPGRLRTTYNPRHTNGWPNAAAEPRTVTGISDQIALPVSRLEVDPLAFVGHDHSTRYGHLFPDNEDEPPS